MNNKGQVLVLFIILLPILLLVGALVIDTGYVLSVKAKLNGTTKAVIRDVWSDPNYETTAQDLFVKNKIPVTNLVIVKNDEAITITNEYQVKSILGSVIGIKSYKIKVKIKGYIQNDKIVFNKE